MDSGGIEPVGRQMFDLLESSSWYGVPYSTATTLFDPKRETPRQYFQPFLPRATCVSRLSSPTRSSRVD